MRTARTQLLIAASLALFVQSSIAGDLELFQPPLKSVWDQPRSEVDDARVKLGKALYFENRISLKNDISCNSCHDLQKFGVDGEGFSKGFEGHRVGRNSPTTFNASGHISQFWDGREPTVEEQAKGPILAAGEMGMPDPGLVVKRLKGIKGYDAWFKAAFPKAKDPVNYDNVGIAIGAFERMLTTPARWDLYLAGHETALNPKEKAGLEKFSKFGCTTCHGGTLLGGRLYQKVGLVKPWPNQKDQGRFDLTKKPEDKMFFKVPSLRNIEKTGPYFHDASSNDLKDAIAKMGRHQLGMELAQQDIAEIEAFLKSTTADIPEDLKAAPVMPDKAQASGGSFD